VDANYQNLLSAYHIYYSTDNGLSWKVLGSIKSASEAVVMTSTPNGRLILFQENGDTPQIYYTTKNTQGNRTLKGPYDVFGIKQGAKVLAQRTSKAIFDRLQIGTPSIMRLIPSSGNMSPNEPSSAVIVAYQAVNSYGNQVYELVVVGMNPNQSEKPTVYGSGQIESSDPNNYSVMHGTFIQPDYLDMPSNVATDMSMFYWIEAPQSNSQPFYAKYGLISFNGYSDHFYLSTSNGSARKITPVPGIGDYLKGGFFWRDGRLNFVPQWAETDGIHANIVSVSPELLPKK
jgi:hypothetical protein